MTLPGYTFSDPYPAIFVVDRAQVSQMKVYRDGELVEPSAATYTLYSPTGQELASPTAAIVSGVATVTVPSTAVDSLDEGYRELWTLTIDGEDHTKYRDAAVCRSPLQCPISQLDLEALYPTLTQNLGTMATSFQTFIDQAWAKILRKMRSSGDMPYIVVQASSLYDSAQHLALHLAHRWWYGQSGGEHFLAQADYHWSQYEQEWGAVSFEVDRDQDGVSDDRDRVSPNRSAIVMPNASPSRYRNKRRQW